jgi:hypothetical protein
MQARHRHGVGGTTHPHHLCRGGRLWFGGRHLLWIKPGRRRNCGSGQYQKVHRLSPNRQYSEYDGWLGDAQY